MNKYFTLEDIDNETLDLFSKFLNELKSDDNVIIIVDSQWWDCSIWDIISSMINDISNTCTIRIAKAFSSALQIIHDSNCVVEVFHNSYWMQHKTSVPVKIRCWWMVWDELWKFWIKEQEESNLDISFLKEDELKLYNDCKDVYLNSTRLKEIFHDKIKKN